MSVLDSGDVFFFQFFKMLELLGIFNSVYFSLFICGGTAGRIENNGYTVITVFLLTFAICFLRFQPGMLYSEDYLVGHNCGSLGSDYVFLSILCQSGTELVKI